MQLFSKQKKVRRVLLCTGKINYDLLEHQETHNIKDVAVVRVEQLYPLPEKQLSKIIGRYGNADLVWVQEEPANMGAWQFMKMNLEGVDLRLISRKASASPATGFKKVHESNQEQIVQLAFE